MEKKVIHYCWFGNNPLPKLAKKCIKSWKKYLPDYEIIRWSEENVDLEACPFIKEAYANKKWAFVADYARTKAMYEYGGIYFDTDMLVKKDIRFLLENGTILGMEDSRMAAAGVWVENQPKSWFSKQMLDFYQKQEHFNIHDMFSISIPRIINKIIRPLGFDHSIDEIQYLKHNVIIYPREYFYPFSYDHQNNIFTENTCMIHYFDASWISKKARLENKLQRCVGKENSFRILNTYRFIKRNSKRVLKVCLFPIVLYRRYKRKYTPEYKKLIIDAIDKIKNYQNFIVFHNPAWLGVTSATIELFDNRVPCGELFRKRDVKLIGDAVLHNDINQVIFSSMCIGWKDLAIYLKQQNPEIKIKTFWHGSHSQVLEPYGWSRNTEIIELHKQGIIDVMGICKRSLLEFYQKEGYKAAFITNRVNLPKKVTRTQNNSKEIRIGLYAAKSDDCRKNMFTQIAAMSLIENVVLDMVPLNPDAIEFAKVLGVKLDGIENSIPRQELIQRLANNDLNLYVTFSECAPMLPLESFEAGVPCLTGNNHHYFKNHELEKYLVVNNEADIEEIAKKAKICLENKEEVMKLCKNWVKENNKNSKNDVTKFMNM